MGTLAIEILPSFSTSLIVTPSSTTESMMPDCKPVGVNFAEIRGALRSGGLSLPPKVTLAVRFHRLREDTSASI